MAPSAYLRLALRNATRKPTRTLLTAGMVVAGVALLVLFRSWIDGVLGGALSEATNVAGEVRVVHEEFAAREQLAPLDKNLVGVDVLVASIREVGSVRSAWPRIQMGVALSAGDELGEVFGFAVGAPRGYFTDQTDVDSKLERGRWFEEGADEVVLGATLANELHADLGAEIVLIGQTQDGSISPVKGTLVGIVRGGMAATDQVAYLPMEKMQWMLDLPGGALEVLVFGPHRQEALRLAEALRARPELRDLSVLAWQERDPWAGMLSVISTIKGLLVGIVLVLAALGVWNTMMMSVLERTSEIGVLRAMGLGRIGTMVLFVGEALAIAVLGGLVGVGLGSIGGYLLETYGVTLGEKVSSSFPSEVPLASTLYGDLSTEVVVQSFLLGLGMAFLGSLLPALRAAFVEPVTAMRTGR
jgi:putative ABC transport system permease protein